MLIRLGFSYFSYTERLPRTLVRPISDNSETGYKVRRKFNENLISV